MHTARRVGVKTILGRHADSLNTRCLSCAPEPAYGNGFDGLGG